MSIGAADLGCAQRWVERGYERKLAVYPGLSSHSFLAPIREDLGLSIEFHAVAADGQPCAGDMGEDARHTRG